MEEEDAGPSRQEDAPAEHSAMDKANALHAETHDILSRLDEIERLVTRAARDAAIKHPTSMAAHSTAAQLDKSVRNLADVESKIESVRRDLERQKQEEREGKERFNAMEVSIKRREEHITRLETIVREEFDDEP